jgi:hypothetical protein
MLPGPDVHYWRKDCHLPVKSTDSASRCIVPEGQGDSSPALQCWVCVKKDDPSRKGRSNTTFSHKRSIVPERDGSVFSSPFPAINCWATFNSPFGVCWTLLGENALGFSCAFGALSPRTPKSRSGLFPESMHEYPRFLHRYSRQADSSSGERRGTHPESHLLQACPVR